MIEMLPAPPHVAAFHFSGTLTAADYDRCIAAVESRLREHARIGLLSDLTGMTGIEPEAMGKDLRYAMDKFGEYRRFARSAVVTERDWLAQVSTFAGVFLPHSELRTFEPGEREAALAWVADIESEPRAD